FAREIRNCKVAVICLGKIGLTAAKLFKGVGANVFDKDVCKKDDIEDIVTQVNLDTLVKESDIISLHVPIIKENVKLVTVEFVSK
ncbi:NAD(P)-dependent oxidoreductase, partial [Streptobacillus felis]|uniref:NAD(P)-dependent oxidoreductase n=1 Tax=Streptobacillus felis TaxID=1384509 RepID=UPI000B298D92